MPKTTIEPVTYEDRTRTDAVDATSIAIDVLISETASTESQMSAIGLLVKVGREHQDLKHCNRLLLSRLMNLTAPRRRWWQFWK